MLAGPTAAVYFQADVEATRVYHLAHLPGLVEHVGN